MSKKETVFKIVFDPNLFSFMKFEHLSIIGVFTTELA